MDHQLEYGVHQSSRRALFGGAIFASCRLLYTGRVCDRESPVNVCATVWGSRYLTPSRLRYTGGRAWLLATHGCLRACLLRRGRAVSRAATLPRACPPFALAGEVARVCLRDSATSILPRPRPLHLPTIVAPSPPCLRSPIATSTPSCSAERLPLTRRARRAHPVARCNLHSRAASSPASPRDTRRPLLLLLLN